MSSVTFFTSDMDKVREEVRALQEHRARVLMEQITEMQKERDVANARIRTLERTVLEVQLENAALSQRYQESSNCIAALERSLLDEQLTVADLKKKFDNQMKAEQNKETDSQNMRRISLFQTESASPTQKSSISRNSSTHTSLGAADAINIVPKRYVLATAHVRSTASQTEESGTNSTVDLLSSNNEDDNSADQRIEVHSKLLSDIEKLQQEKGNLESKLENYKHEQHFRGECKSLQNECRFLKADLGEISRTVKLNLQKFEDDLEICKVIYTLHGCLSQENTVLESTRKKLNESTGRCEELEANCRQLTTVLSEKEEELAKCLNWIQRHLSHRRSQLRTPEKHAATLGRRYTLNT